ncbi:hypothetical protein GCM10022631_36620 [Deinococcus rubellus]|uniref:MFS transporter n=1 Tax=Deinococcus rubellus TaxID=1889240 RepID=A0ABY5YFU1_9DEIO|nr:MFS transporter [Deinococcus rubellus]UWX62967.1 MFS transporter [Deinococcus rubellus]
MKANWTLLGQREYRQLWTAQTLSTFGDALFRVAQVALVLKLGGAAAGLSGVLLANVLPGLLFSLLGGVWADRLNRRRLLVATNAGRALGMALMTCLIWSGRTELWHLYALGVVFGSLSAVGNPAYNALLPQVIAPPQLQAGNALFSVGDSLGYLVGPALAGALLAVIGVGGLAAVNTGALLWMVMTLLTLRVAEQPVGVPHGETLLEQLSQGWRWVVGQAVMLLFLTFFAATNVATPVMGVALPLYVTWTLGEPAAVYGYLLTAMNAGILAASFVLACVHTERAALVTALSVIGIGLSGYLGVGLTRSVVAAALLLALADGLAMVPNILFPTWVQQTAPPELQGRVFGLISVATYALVPLGYVVAAGAVGTWSPPTALMAAGAVLVLIPAAALLYKPFREARGG